jgi:hypothetical protein
VVLDVVGTVEGPAAHDANSRSDDVTERKLVVAPNLHLDAGDELRAARLSRARLRFPAAVVEVGDAARVVIDERGLRLLRGLVTVAPVAEATQPFPVGLDGGAVVVVRGGGARATLLADGKGGVRAVVDGGSLELRSGDHATLVEPGRLLVVDGGLGSLADRPTQLSLSATCAAGRVNVVAPALTQLFVAGSLAYPDSVPGAATGSVSIDAVSVAGDVPVFGRDVAGNVARIVASCGKVK